jgi:hypothetical protein
MKPAGFGRSPKYMIFSLAERKIGVKRFLKTHRAAAFTLKAKNKTQRITKFHKGRRKLCATSCNLVVFFF